MLGGYSSLDGTVEFYGRVNSILRSDFVVLDLGAGRGAWYYEDRCEYHRALRNIRDKVVEYIGADIDPSVLDNPTTHRNVLIAGQHIPIADASADVIIADYVLEHVTDVIAFRDEIARILKPGGLFCARTPHALNYVVITAHIVKNARRTWLLRWAQPYRKTEDIFPTAYRFNKMADISRIFAGWENYSYVYTAEPQYHFGNKIAFSLFSLIHGFAPKSVTGNIFVFVRRPSHAG